MPGRVENEMTELRFDGRTVVVTGAGGNPSLGRAHALLLASRACLTFAGFRTFVGEAVPQDETVLFRVERALPQHPSTLDAKQVLQPAESTLKKTCARLEAEMERHGQPFRQFRTSRPSERVSRKSAWLGLPAIPRLQASTRNMATARPDATFPPLSNQGIIKS